MMEASAFAKKDASCRHSVPGSYDEGDKGEFCEQILHTICGFKLVWLEEHAGELFHYAK